jgi:hypothetical protein
VRTQSWGVPGARAAGECGSCRDVSPGQTAFHLKSTISLRVRFSAPSRIRTCAHGSGEHSRMPPLPAQTRPGLCAWGAYGTREIAVLSSPSAAINSHDPKGIHCVNDHICMSRTWHGCDAG